MDMSKYTTKTLNTAIEGAAMAVLMDGTSQGTMFWIELTADILREKKNRRKRAGKIVKI